jgi:pilus assembly protein CpaE
VPIGSKTENRHTSMKVLLVGDPGEPRNQLKAVLTGLTEPQLVIVEGEAATAANLSENAGTPPDATLVMINGNEDAALNFLQSQSQHTPRPSLFALLNARSPGLMKRALRSGADEILFMPLDPGEATRALLKVSEARWRTERREGGVVISVTSLVGGVGTTSIAANLGLALQSLHQRVALIDLDLQTGGLAVFLNLEPEVTIMPLVRLEHKLDSIQLESALTKHPSGVYLLAAPKRIEEGELVSDLTIGIVLDLIRQLFDYVIVDCGDHVDENAVAAWERSEHLFYVLNQSVAAARSAWRFIDLFERLGLTSLDPSFILNRYSSSHPLTEKAMESTLAKSIHAKIPIDSRTFEAVEMKAQDLFQLASSSTVARAMLDLAGTVMPQTEPAVVHEKFFARLKSAFAG